jgi:hypothetical protein
MASILRVAHQRHNRLKLAKAKQAMVDSEHQRSLLMMIAKAAELSSLRNSQSSDDTTDCMNRRMLTIPVFET